MKFERVNKYLNQLEPINEQEVILDGSEVMKSILVSEVRDINRLSNLSSELLTYLSKDIKKLPRKEQQYFWKDVETVLARKEDWFFKVAQESNRSEFVQKILDMASKPSEKVIAEDGEVIDSSITEENRVQLSNLLVDLLNDQVRS